MQSAKQQQRSYQEVRVVRARPISEATEIFDTDFESDVADDDYGYDSSPRRSVGSVSIPNRFKTGGHAGECNR
jgi:hypothetical protein